VRKKLSAAAGLVTFAIAGALFASSPAYATEDVIPSSSAATGLAPAGVGQQTSVSTSARTLADDGWRRRHRRHHRRHHRHHRRHHRHHHRYWY
jgi:hypothetical protein